ncbi:DEAD/DEAH box helicase [Pseudomonas sp. RT4P38]
MSGYCFYAPDAQDLVELAGIKEIIESFAESNKRQTYVLRKPLSKDDAQYDYDEAVAIFSSGMKPCFINIGADDESFEDYVEFFVEDIAYLSEKFKYREKIGRKRHWLPLFEQCNAAGLDFENLEIDTPAERRLVDLITSLVVGSINDVSKINLEASGLLDTIKSKIILFDTDQTSFVFRSGAAKKFVIQGLAGSGKTELLLHKMKEIYSRDFEARIAFTCFNKILASSMKSRIPNFFDFMRVERQIDWSNKLFCFHSWGSGKEPYSGMYRYICHYYGIPFQSLQAGSFDQVCRTAIVAIRQLSGERKFAFDYAFVDESQDFASSFIELCELVTEKKVFVAGDVFQNIFRPIDEGVNRADMVLKKCYRTDPKNLMFSHALGMGLFESPVLRWLQPHEWDACGYIYNEQNGRALISRDPLRRFEDIPADFKSTTVHQFTDGLSIAKNLVQVVKDIRRRHPTVEQGDIAVILLDTASYIYDVIAQLKPLIAEEMGWGVNVSFETKRSDPDKIFVSNINNAKGLEFPFVICFSLNLHRHPSFRNALYTMMARSFLESHLILGKNVDQDVLNNVNQGLDFLSKNSCMNIRVPSPLEIQQREFIVLDELPSIEEIVRAFCTEKETSPSPRLIAKLIDRMSSIVGETDYDQEYLEALLNAEYQRNRMI